MSVILPVAVFHGRFANQKPREIYNTPELGWKGTSSGMTQLTEFAAAKLDRVSLYKSGLFLVIPPFWSSLHYCSSQACPITETVDTLSPSHHVFNSPQ